MKYTKPPLTFEEQADLLLKKGMTGDKTTMVTRLRTVNYYRLSGYWYTFRNGSAGDFQPGTTFEKVWTRYAFDRRLRLLVMDAIERVEVAFRTRLTHEHAHQQKNPFAYVDDPAALAGLLPEQRAKFLATLEEDLKNSKETFAQHFLAKYGTDHNHMPIWMAAEIMTFGHMLTLYRGSSPQIKRAVAAPLGVHDNVVGSWLLTLNTVRNICAHHCRLWNRGLGTKPMIPKNVTAWKWPVVVGNDRIFGVLTILKYSLDRIAPQSGWPKRMLALLDQYPDIPRVSMGFPANWLECPIWKISTSKGEQSGSGI